jgi:hypothetical protein
MSQRHVKYADTYSYTYSWIACYMFYGIRVLRDTFKTWKCGDMESCTLNNKIYRGPCELWLWAGVGVGSGNGKIHHPIPPPSNNIPHSPFRSFVPHSGNPSSWKPILSSISHSHFTLHIRYAITIKSKMEDEVIGNSRNVLHWIMIVLHNCRKALVWSGGLPEKNV